MLHPAYSLINKHTTEIYSACRAKWYTDVGLQRPVLVGATYSSVSFEGHIDGLAMTLYVLFPLIQWVFYNLISF